MAILPWYATREDVASALDVKLTAYQGPAIDAALEHASRDISGLTHRSFYPVIATKYYDFPNRQHAGVGRIWLDRDLISVTSFTSGGVTVPPANYFLEPVNTGPPYSRIEINRGSASALTSNNSTPQRSLAITGLWGYGADEASAGTAAAAIVSTSATALVCSGDSGIGIGTILRIDSERVIVTGRNWITTSQTVQTPLSSSLANQSLDVTTGGAYSVGETLMLDQERVLVLEIFNNQLTVKRAQQGSTLAAHTGSTIYSARSLVVTRGALGTTAATHLISAPLFRHLVPGPVQKLTVAYAIETLMAEGSGYARMSGSGSSESNVPNGTTLAHMEEMVYSRYARKVRARAV